MRDSERRERWPLNLLATDKRLLKQSSAALIESWVVLRRATVY